MNALARPEVGKYLNRAFVSTYQKVGTFRLAGSDWTIDSGCSAGNRGAAADASHTKPATNRIEATPAASTGGQ